MIECNWDRENPLARVKPDSPAAHRALQAYALLGPTRPSQKKFRAQYLIAQPQERFTETTMARWSYQCCWLARVSCFDDLELQRQVDLFKLDAEQNRAARIKILKAYLGKVTQAMLLLSPEEASWSNVTAAARMVVEQLRAEYAGSTYEAQRGRGRPTSAEEALFEAFADLSDAELEEQEGNLDAAVAAATTIAEN